jgi:hypothetical protein
MGNANYAELLVFVQSGDIVSNLIHTDQAWEQHIIIELLRVLDEVAAVRGRARVCGGLGVWVQVLCS